MPVDIAQIRTPERLLCAAQAVAQRAEHALRSDQEICEWTYQSFISEGRQLIVQAERLIGMTVARLFGCALLFNDPVCTARTPWRFHLEGCLQVVRQLVVFLESSVRSTTGTTAHPSPCVTI